MNERLMIRASEALMVIAIALFVLATISVYTTFFRDAKFVDPVVVEDMDSLMWEVGGLRADLDVQMRAVNENLNGIWGALNDIDQSLWRIQLALP